MMEQLTCMARRIRRRRMGFSLVAACLLQPLMEPLVPVAMTLQAQERRTYNRKLWRMTWGTGGRLDDTLFGWIREHVMTRSAVYVLDAGSLQVHAFDPLRGTHQWSIGRRGSGPGEFRAPVDIALSPRGFAVLDQGNGRVSRFDGNGKHLGDIVNTEFAFAKALCVLADESVVVHLGREAAFLARFAPSGQQIKQWAFPWPNTDIGNPLLISANSIRGQSDTECHFATTFGFGLVRIAADNTLRTTPFLEEHPRPEFVVRTGSNGLRGTYLERGHNASSGGLRWGDTLAVQAFNTKGQLAGLDLYHRVSGKYLASWRLPGDDRFAFLDGILISLSASRITQSIRAWADVVDTTRILKAMGQLNSQRTPSRPVRSDTPARPSAPARVPPPASR